MLSTILQTQYRRISASRVLFWPHLAAMPPSCPLPHAPVNIIVHTPPGKGDLVHLVRSGVSGDEFAVYGVDDNSLLESAWDSSCRLLVLTDSVDQPELNTRVKQYIDSGGEYITLSLPATREQLEILLKHRQINTQTNQAPEDLLKSKPGLLWSSPGKKEFLRLDSVRDRVRNSVLSLKNLQIKFISGEEGEGEEKIMNLDCEQCLESLTARVGMPVSELSPDFNLAAYSASLSTRELGHHLLYLPRVGSSMAVLEGPPLVHGLAVIPQIQTQGRGRGGNTWLSPPGCAMFSLQVHLAVNSPLGRRPSLLQHLAALAVVLGLRAREECRSLDIGIKWPNDIYYSKSVKIGGVIANSSCCNGNFVINIGCGLNLNNKLPTVSINHLLHTRGEEGGITQEEYFGLVFTKMEELMEKFNSGEEEEIFALYHRHWLHTGQAVTVARESRAAPPDTASRAAPPDTASRAAPESATVLGIDEFGYLRVRAVSDGEEFTVFDDGNSFDMMQGLIRPKM